MKTVALVLGGPESVRARVVLNSSSSSMKKASAPHTQVVLIVTLIAWPHPRFAVEVGRHCVSPRCRAALARHGPKHSAWAPDGLARVLA